MDSETAAGNAVTLERWLQIGVDNGWLIAGCLMHDFEAVFTETEQARYAAGDDPCVIRLVVANATTSDG